MRRTGPTTAPALSVLAVVGALLGGSCGPQGTPSPSETPTPAAPTPRPTPASAVTTVDGPLDLTVPNWAWQPGPLVVTEEVQ